MKSQNKINNTGKIFEQLSNDYNLDVKLTDHDFIWTYITEQEGYDDIMGRLKKSDRDENEKDLFTF